MVSKISSMSGIMSKKQTAMKTPPEKQEAMVLNLELSSCLKTEKGAKGINEHNAVTRNMTMAKINFSVFCSIFCLLVFFPNPVSFSVLTSWTLLQDFRNERWDETRRRDPVTAPVRVRLFYKSQSRDRFQKPLSCNFWRVMDVIMPY